jgi:peptide/nickel transport system substrate-binding protein
VLLSCASFHKGSDSSINIAGFCDKDIDSQMQDALKLGQTDQQAANAKWTQIDQAIMKKSPLVPVITPKLVDFLSKRVGNYQFSKQFYMLVGQLWVQ